MDQLQESVLAKINEDEVVRFRHGSDRHIHPHRFRRRRYSFLLRAVLPAGAAQQVATPTRRADERYRALARQRGVD